MTQGNQFGAMLKSIVNQDPGTFTTCDIGTKGIESIEVQMNNSRNYDLWVKTVKRTYFAKDLPVEDVLTAFISVCKKQVIPDFILKR